MKFKKGFTLAEVLITLAIIGVVAAISIPSVIANVNQMEYKTGLRKAVSVLNSAITMNVALDGETPYDNANLWTYLQRHMSVMESVPNMTKKYVSYDISKMETNKNYAFYTTDGMRFELKRQDADAFSLPYFMMYEKPGGKTIFACDHFLSNTGYFTEEFYETINDNESDIEFDPTLNQQGLCYRCGSYGLANNPNNTQYTPCIVTVDVNGDRKPSPANVRCAIDKNNPDLKSLTKAQNACGAENVYKYSDALGKKLTDVFSIMITDRAAIPFGYAAQKAMYQAQK